MSQTSRPSTAREAGALTAEQMELVLRHLPVDVSVTDAEHVLVYWRGPTFEDCDETFIGRHVDECHNPTSRAHIKKMVEAFTAGTRDEAVFWDVEDGHQKVTRYVALRDAEGTYRGMMEVIIDVTALEGYRGKGNDLGR